jgi:hypothetical protein
MISVEEFVNVLVARYVLTENAFLRHAILIARPDIVVQVKIAVPVLVYVVPGRRVKMVSV